MGEPVQPGSGRLAPVSASSVPVPLLGSHKVMIPPRHASVLRGARRFLCFLALCLCFGTNIWATHFVSMLAFSQGMPVHHPAARAALYVFTAVLGALPVLAPLVWRPAARLAWGWAGMPMTDPRTGAACGEGGGGRANAAVHGVTGARLLRRHQLEQEFQSALRNREFRLFYQPLYDCRSLKLRGFEALARWRHPARGMIGPDEFIPVAEAGGMIAAFGEYALEEACRAARSWPEDLRVAVNLSPVQLKNPALPESVAAALARSGLAPHRLELELTEGAMLEHTAEVQISLAALKESGVSLAIDDFGAGYSSLSYLHRFSFERLKIDKSLTREITVSPDARIVTAAIIGLGAALGMAVLAEGVETEAQLNILRKAGCGQVQGYLLGKPMPEEDVLVLLEHMGRTGGRAVPALG